MPDGTHWFPAVDVCKRAGLQSTRAPLWRTCRGQSQLRRDARECARKAHSQHSRRSRVATRHEPRGTSKGLIRLVNGCTKPESQPFKAWVSAVIATIQRDGSYSLEPVPRTDPPPTGATAYVMPQQIADAIVRLEDDGTSGPTRCWLAFQEEQANSAADQPQPERDGRGAAADRRVARPPCMSTARRPRRRRRSPKLTPQQLLATWKAKNLVVTEDVHAVAAYLAPALAARRGPLPAGGDRHPYGARRRRASTTACACCSSGAASGRRAARRTERPLYVLP